MLPLFKRSEGHEDGESEWHGGSGELSVSRIRAKSEIAEAFIDAAVEMGVPRTNDYNGPEQEGAGYFHQTARGGFRCSSARAFLKPARGRPNLDIITHAHIESLSFADDEARRVTGVNFRRRGTPQTIKLRDGGEVILSAGAIGSPQILELSGIGQGEVKIDRLMDKFARAAARFEGHPVEYSTIHGDFHMNNILLGVGIE